MSPPALLVVTVVLLTAMHPTGHPAARPVDSWTLEATLSYGSGNHTRPLASVVADLLLVNATNATPVDNFTLSNGANYTGSDFGASLTDVTDVMVFVAPAGAYANASYYSSDVNVTAGGVIPLDVQLSPANATVPGNTTTIFPPSPNLPTLPLLLGLVGVGLLAFSGWLGFLGLRRMTGVFREGEY